SCASLILNPTELSMINHLGAAALISVFAIALTIDTADAAQRDNSGTGVRTSRSHAARVHTSRVHVRHVRRGHGAVRGAHPVYIGFRRGWVYQSGYGWTRGMYWGWGLGAAAPYVATSRVYANYYDPYWYDDHYRGFYSGYNTSPYTSAAPAAEPSTEQTQTPG